jgi:heterodisulfide reductase subunit A
LVRGLRLDLKRNTDQRQHVEAVMRDNAFEENIRGSVLVVGAGIAGMQAALDMANSGYYVYMVEKSPAIGGAMAQLDKTFPTNDCSM